MHPNSRDRFPLFFIPFLVGLGTLGYLGADMYLPAFSLLETAFNTTESAIGLTFSLYMFGLALGQLFYGTLSDRFGRKTTLNIGLLLFITATLGCIYSEHINALLAWRFLQALGACAATVLWQAIVIDKYNSDTAHKIFAIVFPLVALSPALAPTIGGGLIILFPWQGIFIVLTGIGIVLLLCIAFFLTETTTAHSRKHATINFLSIKEKHVTLLTSPVYMGYICTLALTSAAYFCYLTASPFLLERMGYSPVFVGLSYVPQTLLFMLGGFISKKVVDHFGAIRTMRFSLYAFVLFAAVFFAITVLLPLTHALQIIVPFCFMALFSGILYPTGMSMALNHFPQLVGTAAGLGGSIQAFTAFATTSFLALILFAGVFSLALMVVLLAVMAWLCFRLTVQSH